MKKAILAGVSALAAVAATAAWTASAPIPPGRATAPTGEARVPVEAEGGGSNTRLMFGPLLAGIAQSDRPGRPAAPLEKKRLFVLTDMENEPDDAQSLVRLLVYSNLVDIEGITATTSTHLRDFVAPETIRKIVRAYGRVQPNLLKHAPGFPTEQYLLSRIYQGPVKYGMQGVGDGHDSTGSEALIQALQRPDPRPLWVSGWGGPNVLAQALYKIQKTLPAAEANRLISKLRVYTISDQDDSGPWMRRAFPNLFYIVSPGSNYGAATWRGMSAGGPGVDMTFVSPAWLAQNIQQGHGPLGLEYPDTAYTMEGDTPSFLGLIANGLNDLEHPEWGGWGGRYELSTPGPQPAGGGRAGAAAPAPPNPLSLAPNSTASMLPAAAAAGGETRPIWFHALDTWPVVGGRGGGGAPAAAPATAAGRAGAAPAPAPAGAPPAGAPAAAPPAAAPAVPVPDNRATVWRWRHDFQNDFAARMDWTIKPYAEANHNPVAILNGPDRFTVRSGDIFTLSAEGSWDPDGDSLVFDWVYYQEAGSFRLPFPTQPRNMMVLRAVRAPVVTKPETAHFVLRVTDRGTPALTSYRRIIITVVPN